jgi:hypothetical protein
MSHFAQHSQKPPLQTMSEREAWGKLGAGRDLPRTLDGSCNTSADVCQCRTDRCCQSPHSRNRTQGDQGGNESVLYQVLTRFVLHQIEESFTLGQVRSELLLSAFGSERLSDSVRTRFYARASSSACSASFHRSSDERLVIGQPQVWTHDRSPRIYLEIHWVRRRRPVL